MGRTSGNPYMGEILTDEIAIVIPYTSHLCQKDRDRVKAVLNEYLFVFLGCVSFYPKPKLEASDSSKPASPTTNPAKIPKAVLPLPTMAVMIATKTDKPHSAAAISQNRPPVPFVNKNPAAVPFSIRNMMALAKDKKNIGTAVTKKGTMKDDLL
jgi:hypothetical protein